MSTGLSERRLVRLIFGVLALWLAAWEVHRTILPRLGGALFDPNVHVVGLVIASGMCLLRAVKVRDERLGWGLVGAGLLAWSLGELYYVQHFWNSTNIPIPSWADAGYLAFIPLVFSGLIVLLRTRVRNVSRMVWIDGITAGLAVASLSAAVVFESVLAAVGGQPLSVATNLAYPLGDLLLLGVITWAFALIGWRADRTWSLLGLGIIFFWIADSLYLIGTAQGWYATGSVFDAGWWLGILLISIAAWQRPRTARPPARREAVRTIAVPLGFASIGLGVLVVSSLDALNPVAVGLAAASLVGVMLRLAMTFRENIAMLRTSREEALTDALTGLANRRQLMLDLETELPINEPGRSLVLVLFDLDGFKSYNDTFGHPAGDALLTRLGCQLTTALTGRGRAYRIGGDEFCALITPGSQIAAQIITTAASALSEHGDGFAIDCSHGSVTLPWEAETAAQAMRLADRRMYVNKDTGRLSPGRQSKDVLLRAMIERDPDLARHLTDVADLAVALAQQIAVPDDQLEQIRRAAELHDVGKVAIPDAILNKPGSLTPAEWQFVHAHTLIGERIVSAAPALGRVAALVRSTHENFDGSGYPDRLAGHDIPISSRIIAVCDAYHAMTTDRAYRAARTPCEAIDELRRCAQTQFDPLVVEAFCQTVAHRANSQVTTLAS